MKARGTITPETYGHRVYTIEDINKHEFTDDEIEYINAAIDAHNKDPTLELPSQLLFGLLQKLQTNLKLDDHVASKMIILASNNTIDEMHKDFDVNSFYAGAAWYSRELAKMIYELIDEMKQGD